MAKIESSYARRKRRIRYKLRKNAGDKFRLNVHRSGKHIYAQVINDKEGRTVAAASTVDPEFKDAKGWTTESAKKVGEMIAARAKKAKAENVYFDRSGYLFHGRVQALADGAREAGLKF